MKRLIVNADDFGFTPGVNAGVIHAYKTGIVTSTTIMANGEAFDDAVALALANPGLGVGCHLAIVGGRPVAQAEEVPSIVDDDGLLRPTLGQFMLRLARGSVRSDDIAREFRAQVMRVVSAGIIPTHFDSHKHSHVSPPVMKALALVAREFRVTRVRNPFESVFDRAALSGWTNIKQSALSAVIAPGAIRFKRLARLYLLNTPDRFLGVKRTGMLDTEAIRSMMKGLKEGTAELMCHPGFYDSGLESAHTRLKKERERELEALTDPSLRLFAEQSGIELISYREL
ncbi:MAG TPA: ChbG/HpnK family deacetylase [Blastocatellia bacterium]|nr:ChbG/HpnK family deacetylase [Blastocatellia bacterium]